MIPLKEMFPFGRVCYLFSRTYLCKQTFLEIRLLGLRYTNIGLVRFAEKWSLQSNQGKLLPIHARPQLHVQTDGKCAVTVVVGKLVFQKGTPFVTHDLHIYTLSVTHDKWTQNICNLSKSPLCQFVIILISMYSFPNYAPKVTSLMTSSCLWLHQPIISHEPSKKCLGYSLPCYII